MMFITSLVSRSLRLWREAVMLTSTPRAPARLTPSSSGQATACSAAMRARSMPRGLRRAHHRHALLGHHGAHVLEVDVHQAGQIDDLGDAGDRAVQHVVGGPEGLFLRDVVTEHLLELVVEDHDQRVDVRRKLVEPLLGEAQALRPSKANGLVTTATVRMPSERAISAITGAAPVPGTTAHAGGDEHHVRTRDRLLEPLALGERRGARLLRLCAGAQPAGAELDLVARRDCGRAPARRCSPR